MKEFEQLASYLANIFNGYVKKTERVNDITNIKLVLEDVFPEKSVEIQTAFGTRFPDIFTN